MMFDRESIISGRETMIPSRESIISGRETMTSTPRKHYFWAGMYHIYPERGCCLGEKIDLGTVAFSTSTRPIFVPGD